MPEPPNREKEIFSEALEVDSSQARLDYLESACGPDEALRQRVEALLEAHASAEGFIPIRETTLAPGLVRLTEQPGTIIDRYTLLKKIGEGGFGSVYLAEQNEPVKRRVALKIIKLGMDTNQVVARFEAERQTLALMDHPNIAKVLDGGATENGRVYFVMELVQGVAITQYCDENNLSAADRLELFIQVCRAIEHAHQKGIIHRDIKPSNILVTLRDGIAMPRVIDFGIAKATQQALSEKTVFTQFQQFLGTPAYMSPEQAEMSSVDIDTRSDIYALGVLLYELLTGTTPFDTKELLASGLDEMRRIIRERDPVRPSTRVLEAGGTPWGAPLKTASRKSRIDPDLDWIVMKCLEKNRTRRYETANALAVDIRCHLNSEPVLARPPSAVYRLRKTIRRNKLAFVALAGLMVTLLLGVAASTWQAVRATRAQRAASLASEKLLHQLYVSKMNLAQTVWEQNNVGAVRQLLDETIGYPGRGFEWYYWERQMHLELKTLRGHLGPVLAATFSPDSRRIVTGSADQTAMVWDTATGWELFSLTGHSGVISSAAFSPDGQRILTGSWDHTARLWDAVSGSFLFALNGHSGAIHSVVFSPDGRRVATSSADKTTAVWDAIDGHRLFTLNGHSARIFSVAFSPDGQRIATGGWDGTVRVSAAVDGTEALKLEAGAPIFSVAFSKDGRQIVAGASDSTVKMWNATTGEQLANLTQHNAPVYSVAVSPDGQRLLSGSFDQTAKVWQAANGKELFTLKGHTSGVLSVAFSPDSERIVTSSGIVAIGLDGEPFLVGAGPGTAKVWAAASGDNSIILVGHSNGVFSVAFSPDGRHILTGSWDATARVWDAAGGKTVLTLTGHVGPVYSVAYSPDGQRIVTGSVDQTAKVWDAASGTNLITIEAGTPITFVAYSSDGKRIVTGGETAIVWDATTAKERFSLKGHTNIWSVAFSPDCQRIVTGSWDKTAKVWDATTGQCLLTLEGHRTLVRAAAFSGDGRRIVTGSVDQTAIVWDTISGKLLLRLQGHGSTVFSVSFSPDGQRILTSSADHTARVWDASTGDLLLTLRGHSDRLFSAAFSPDGQRIVTGGGDNLARIWETASKEQVANWQKVELTATE